MPKTFVASTEASIFVFLKSLQTSRGIAGSIIGIVHQTGEKTETLYGVYSGTDNDNKDLVLNKFSEHAVWIKISKISQIWRVPHTEISNFINLFIKQTEINSQISDEIRRLTER